MTDAPTDADTEAGRGEGRSYDNMTSSLLSQRLEAIAMGEDRHEADDPHVMLAAARRLRESDPGGEPVAWALYAVTPNGRFSQDVYFDRERLEDEPSARPYADGGFLRHHAEKAEAEGYDHVAFLLRHAGKVADDRARYRRKIMQAAAASPEARGRQ